MSPQAQREYTEIMHLRYKKATTRAQKGKILDEYCATCQCHRKHGIRKLRGFKRFTKPKPKKRGRRAVYHKPDIATPLKTIWLAANLPCSKRLKVILPLWLRGYEQTYGKLAEDVYQALVTISAATIDRLLRPSRLEYTQRGRSTTKPGTLLKKQIAIGTNQWDESRPGFIEADTVAHCGQSMMGQFAFTVDCVDIATGWTEQRAVWGRGEAGVLEQMKDIENMMPFELLGFDCDNGGEFLNYHLLRHFTDRKRPVKFTRSRAYHSQDNAHVEQKNWTHVRQWIGYDRLDKAPVVPLLNDLYRTEWRLFHNFFLPSVKLIDKERIGSKTLKRHDKPKTPYQRIMDSEYLDDATKTRLRNQFATLNPFLLRKNIESKLKKIFSL
jgi:hypothetical protein